MPIGRKRPKPENFNRNANLPFRLRLEDFEIAMLRKYQTDAYRSLNRALRGLEPMTRTDLTMAKKIDRLVERRVLPRDVIVYRGFIRNVVNELEPGDTFTDNGFSSAKFSARQR